jgi:hypothetical protein
MPHHPDRSAHYRRRADNVRGAFDRHSLRSLTGYDGLPLTDVEVLDVRRPESAAPRDVAADARIAIRGKLTCASSASRTR